MRLLLFIGIWVLSVFAFFKRVKLGQHKWRRLENQPEGVFFHISKYKNFFICRLSVPADSPFQFILRKEGYSDAILQSLGLSKKQNLNDSAIDESEIFLEYQGQDFPHFLKGHPSFKNLLLEMVKNSTASKSVFLKDGRLWLETYSSGDPKKLLLSSEMDPTLAQCVQQLLELQKYLRPSADRSEIPPTAHGADWFKALTYGTALSSMVSIVLLTQPGLIYLQPNQSLKWILLTSFFAVVLYFIAAARLLRFSAKLNQVLFNMMPLFTLFVFLISFGLIDYANIVFDKTPSQTHQTKIAAHAIEQGYRNGPRYCVYLAPWSDQITQDQKVCMTRDKYIYALSGTGSAQIQIKPGRLGFAWISALEFP